MARFPIKLPSGKTVEAQEFTDGDERVVLIGERIFRIRPLDEPGTYYTMVKVGGTKRSVRGILPELHRAIGQIFEIYRTYDDRARRAKEDAQKARDRSLHEVVEELSA